jgi:DNA-binding transcriptional ArsR family regulator
MELGAVRIAARGYEIVATDLTLPLDKRSGIPDNSAMPDQSVSPDHLPAPGYELAPTLPLSPDQLKVFFDDTRTTILDLLSDSAATTTQIAKALDMPKGTVGHHMKVLEQHGLIRVVRTKKVRAIEAKYYGRTARTFLLGSKEKTAELEIEPGFIFREALEDVSKAHEALDQLEGKPATGTIRHVRIPDDQAAEWVDRLHALLDEFIQQPRGGDTSYGFVMSLYPTMRPVINGDDE